MNVPLAKQLLRRVVVAFVCIILLYAVFLHNKPAAVVIGSLPTASWSGKAQNRRVPSQTARTTAQLRITAAKTLASATPRVSTATIHTSVHKTGTNRSEPSAIRSTTGDRHKTSSGSLQRQAQGTRTDQVRQPSTIRAKQQESSGHGRHDPPLVGELHPGGFLANSSRASCMSGQHQRQPHLVIVVTTAPSHRRHRQAIRLTWGSVAQRTDVTMVFLVGVTRDTDVQRLLDEEKQEFDDLVQATFVDSYSNLTLKSVSMLEWVHNACPQASMILKTDDDMFVNPHNLIKFFQVNNKVKRTIFGRLAKKWRPVRNVKSKYCLDKKTFPSVFLPDFLTGPAYVLSGDLVEELYRAALTKPYIKLEDVFLTGVVGDDIHVRRVASKEFINDQVKTDTCRFQNNISVHMVKYHEQFDIWKRISDGRTICPASYVPTKG